jgi:hypothetical protein
MRSGFVPLMTVLLFLFHVVTESVSHHGKFSEATLPIAGCCAGLGVAPVPCAANCGHSHGTGHNTCQGTHCVFVPGKSRTDSLQNRRESDRSITAEQPNVGLPARLRRQGLSSAAASSIQPVRRHLMLQILLL